MPAWQAAALTLGLLAVVALIYCTFFGVLERFTTWVDRVRFDRRRRRRARRK